MIRLSQLAAAAALIVGMAGVAEAMPAEPLSSGEGNAAIAEAANYCVPRVGYAYRRGYGTILVITGWNCPIAAIPFTPRIGPGPDPAQFQRLDPRYR